MSILQEIIRSNEHKYAPIVNYRYGSAIDDLADVIIKRQLYKIVSEYSSQAIVLGKLDNNFIILDVE